MLWLALYSSLARYETFSEGYAKIEIAGWEIALNGRTLKSGENILRNTIKLVPTENIDTADPEKISPGQKGYFDIVINPEGTEVSFAYRITMDSKKSSLPDGVTIDSYSVNDGGQVALPEDKTVEGAVKLAASDVLGADDVQKIRYYWKWSGTVQAEAAAGYDIAIAVRVELKQALQHTDGFTSARFYSVASMSSSEKVAGAITLYRPDWVYGYESASGTFSVSNVPTDYPNIHYSVQNKVDDVVNAEEAQYYLRIVAEDGSENLPIEYDVHAYNSPEQKYIVNDINKLTLKL